MGWLRERDPELVEWMDRTDCDPEELAATYRDFPLVNRWIAGWRGIYETRIRPLMTEPGRSYRLLDVGCGGGDVALLLHTMAARDGIRLEVTGIDPDPRALAFSGPGDGMDVTFLQARAEELSDAGKRFDFVVTNHVLHHLPEDEIPGFLHTLASLATRRVICNDIRRSPVAYVLFQIVTFPFLGRRGFIRRDGLTSIRRSFTPGELGSRLPEGWRVVEQAPFRILLLCDVESVEPAPGTGSGGPSRKRDSAPELDLVVVGGGPVGLLAGLAAVQAGLRCMVLERRSREDRPGKAQVMSRAIGIHPPAQDLLELLGVGPAFQSRGTAIPGGYAMTDGGRLLGTLEFTSLPGQFRHVLTLPQTETEAILREALHSRAVGCLQEGAEVVSVRGLAREEGLTVVARMRGGRSVGEGLEAFSTRFVLACDGKRSRLRAQAGIPFVGGGYPHRYVMGDFPDETPFGPRATIYLARAGLVESFPLPQGLRRWVIQRSHPLQAGERPPPDDAMLLEELTDDVLARCGTRLEPGECRMLSPFSVERYRAGSFWQGRIILGGDAAHVVSPIGGQGMNLGWIHAVEAVEAVATAIGDPHSLAAVRHLHNRQVGRRTRKAHRRGEWNMFLGNRRRYPRLRGWAISALLRSPLRTTAARRFTMSDLGAKGRLARISAGRIGAP